MEVAFLKACSQQGKRGRESLRISFKEEITFGFGEGSDSDILDHSQTQCSNAQSTKIYARNDESLDGLTVSEKTDKFRTLLSLILRD